MKACLLYGIGDLRYEDVTTPTPGKGEVLIRIKASGICGSDIQRIFTKGTYNFPTIPGHEFAGEIVETGNEVCKSLLGKRTAVFPLIPCMHCDACVIGEYAQCSDYNYFGSRCDGGYAEYISVPVWNLVMVEGTDISFEAAAMTEPAAVAIHALRQAGIEIGDGVAIFGAGPIGLLLAQWSKVWGADHVMLIDIDDQKIEFAKKIGFENVWNSNEGDAVEWIRDITRGRGADISVEGAGVSATLEQCLKCTRPFGKVVAMGNPIGNMNLSQTAYWDLLRKQLKVSGTWNSSYTPLPKNDWVLALRAIETGKIDLKPLITHRIGLENAVSVLEMMRDKTEFYNKVMFKI